MRIMLQTGEKNGIMFHAILGSSCQEINLDITGPVICHTKEKGCVQGHMVSIDIDIFEAAKYVVCLHYKADTEYTCNRTKIEKLLAIADLIFIKSGKRLFPQWPIYINSCGIGYRALSTDSFLFPIDNIMPGEDLSKFIDNFRIKLNNQQDIPSTYETELPDENKRKVIEDVFCCFGAYTAKLIGSTIDEFKEFIQGGDASDEVDKEKAMAFLSEDSDLVKTNIIAKFICEYPIVP